MLSILFYSGNSNALPIGFRYNQGNKVFLETKSKNFSLYHDEKASEEARFTLHVLENAKPIVEEWFQVQRTGPLLVNMSAHSDNASFANFIFDDVELQTQGQGNRDLAWHEYVHSSMYRHFDTFLGPAGSVLTLPWMSAWMIEGLAEALSVSIGSDIQAGVERYYVFTNQWPTFARLHSLYSSDAFFLSGYATSGAFVRYLLQDQKANIAEFLKDFTSKSRPWMWPATVIPFIDFMPEDAALKNQFKGKNGALLYDEYKLGAAQHWGNEKPKSFFSQTNVKRRLFAHAPNIRFENSELFYIQNDEQNYRKQKLTFDSNSNFVLNETTLETYGGNYATSGIDFNQSKERVHIKNNLVDHHGTSRAFLFWQKSGKVQKKSLQSQFAFHLTESGQYLAWIEQEIEETRFCFSPKKNFAKKCTMSKSIPDSLNILSDNRSDEIFVKLKHQDVLGDHYEIFKVDFTQPQKMFQKIPWQHYGEPLQILYKNNFYYTLTAEKSHRVIKKMSIKSFSCIAEFQFVDLPFQLVPMSGEDWATVLFDGQNFSVRKFSINSLKFEPCKLGTRHDSPLLASLRAKEVHRNLTLPQAIAEGGIWNETSEVAKSENLSTASETAVAESYHWRGKPAFLFPWIGADDALGPQLGIISVPLIDNLQNEMLRVSALVGIYSRFPNTDISLSSTRFYPTLNASFYRAQTYNGRIFNNESQTYQSSYLDEKGFHADASYPVIFERTAFYLGVGMRVANLKPYIGEDVVTGNVNEPYLSLSHSWNYKRWTWQNLIATRATPESVNPDFAYDVLGASTSISYNLKKFVSNLNLRLDGSRTRGNKRRDIQEIYYPIKTFVAGSGGGYNKNNLPVVSAGTLFSPRFGDTQARSQMQYVHPLIRSIDKFFWILYLDRLDFTMFYNYGGAWFEGDESRGFSRSRLASAQGYNMDLQFDNKGVRFNLGFGAGQVFGENLNAYLTSGFDAIF